MSDFDTAARFAGKQLDPEGFLGWPLPGVFAAWRWAGWLDARAVAFPGEPARQADLVAVFTRRAGDAPPAAAVVEFQTRPQGDMLERLAEYVLRLRRELPYQRDPRVSYEAVGVLVNLTGPAQADVWDMAPPDFGDLGLRFRAGVRTLRDVDAAGLLSAIAQGQVARCLLPSVPLMRGADQPAVVDEWKRLASQEAEPRQQAVYGALAKVFADLAGRLDVWGTGLEGWNVEISQVVEEWRAEGRAEGRAEALRANLLRVLEVRFAAGVPAELVTAVNAQKDPATLDSWFDRALTAGSLDEVRSAFGLA
jgi:hypothetical protein